MLLDIFPTVLPFLFALASIFLAVSILISSFPTSKKKRCTVPEAAGAWPIFGHFTVYKGSKNLTHVAFGDMADVYGPIFGTKAGTQTSLVISSQEIAKELYTIHDKHLDRPSVTASKILGYNNSFLTFSPYGSYWRQMRKVTTMDLLSTHRIDILKNCRAREVEIFVRDLYRRWEKRGRTENGLLLDMKPEFQNLTDNISLMMVAKKRYLGDSPNCDKEEATKDGKLIQDFEEFFALYLFSDFIPFLGWLEWRTKRAMTRTTKEIDELLEGWVVEHTKKMKDSHGRDEDEKDFFDLLIDIFESSKIPGLDAHKTTKALYLNMILAGSQTTIVVLVWALSLLLNNPHILKKAQEELDKCIGKNRNVEESDIKDLVYLQAIVKETFRLYPPVPLIAFRFVTEDFDIANGNYHVPVGTQVLVNAWKIQRDSSIWENPEKFEPERFMGDKEGVDVGGQSFKLMPFGLGKRSCPAIPLGMRMVHYVLARFLHNFHIHNPSSDRDVHMSESNGLVNLKATPLHVILTPRLDPRLYQFP